jgi:hypothetical protein
MAKLFRACAGVCGGQFGNTAFIYVVGLTMN